MAYSSDKSGRPEIYIQSFPKPGSERRISTEGGVQPRWRRDGRELFYIDPVLKLMSVELTALMEPSSLKKLFDTRLNDNTVYPRYAVTSDGQKFLINEPIQTGVPAITVIVNWPAHAQR